VLDRLEQAGTLDETLLVVVADHGVSFRPGHSRRVPDGENLADILSVPLLMKLPGQRVGAVSDRNVESIDVLPTIAAALNLELPTPVDGDSLLDDSIRPRPRKSVQSDAGATVATADFPERFLALERMLDIFGSGTHNDRLWAPLGPYPELIHRSLDQFELSPSGDVRLEVLDHLGGGRDGGPQTACLLVGSVLSPRQSPAPIALALAAGGRIIATTLTTADPRLPDRWSCLLTGLDRELEPEDVQVFAIRPTEDGVRLEPCQVTVVVALGT
jgi:hypothetical protein